MPAPYLDTPTLDLQSWPHKGETTFALHERKAPLLEEEQERAASEDTSVVGARPLRPRRQREVTRPELDPFAEALVVAGFLPTELMSVVMTPEDLRYEKENVTRLELLARRFVSKEFSPEAEARLRIATQRVRRLLPRITPQDFYAIGDELLRINEIRKKYERIRKQARLGD